MAVSPQLDLHRPRVAALVRIAGRPAAPGPGSGNAWRARSSAACSGRQRGRRRQRGRCGRPASGACRSGPAPSPRDPSRAGPASSPEKRRRSRLRTPWFGATLKDGRATRAHHRPWRARTGVADDVVDVDLARGAGRELDRVGAVGARWSRSRRRRSARRRGTRVRAQTVAPAGAPATTPRTTPERSEATRSSAAVPSPNPAVSAEPPPTADAGQALSIQTWRDSQVRFGKPSSARSSTHAVTTLSGPVVKAVAAVGTAADSVVVSGQGLSAVAKPACDGAVADVGDQRRSVALDVDGADARCRRRRRRRSARGCPESRRRRTASRR